MPTEWKLVPVEPTEEMIVAFAEAWYSKRQAIDDPDMLDAYRDMLLVAPQPPALGGEVTVLAAASFSKNGNIQCWSLRRDHESLRKLETEGHQVVELVDRAHVARLQAEVYQLKRWQETVRENSPLLIRLEQAEARNAELEDLLRDIKNSHGVMLMTCPPQDPWVNNRIDERINAVLSEGKS